MNITIEIENKEDFPFIKKLMENLKGVKILDKETEEIADDGVPMWFYNELETYADNLQPDELISEEEILKFIAEEKCRLQQAD